MGWSFGGLGALSLLAHSDAIPAEARQKLASYFRQLILYSRFFSFVFPISETCSELLLDPAEVIFGYFFGYEDGVYPATFEHFPIWASNYYIHPDLTSRTGARASTIDSSKPPSFPNMTDKEVAQLRHDCFPEE